MNKNDLMVLKRTFKSTQMAQVTGLNHVSLLEISFKPCHGYCALLEKSKNERRPPPAFRLFRFLFDNSKCHYALLKSVVRKQKEHARDKMIVTQPLSLGELP